MSSDPENSSNDKKRPRMDLGPSPQCNTTPDPNQIQLIWKAPEFVKTTEPIGRGISGVVYKTSEIKFKSLLWCVEIRPHTETILKYPHAKEQTLMACELWAGNETDQDQGVDFVGRYTVTTAYHHNGSHKGVEINELMKTTRTGYFHSSNVDKLSSVHTCMLSWFESEFPNESCSDEDYMSITIDYLGETISDRKARIFQVQGTLLDQMKEEVKGIHFFLKLNHVDTRGTGDGSEPKEDFVIESKNGIETGFNKALLKVRGGDFFNGCLSSEMTESRTSRVKLENFDNDIILGFKEYLYCGKLPYLDTNAVEYFKFGEFSGLEQIKSLAELELCKNIDMEEFMLQAVEIARRYQTKYLKNEIMGIWKKDPEIMEKLILANFDGIDYSKVLK